MLIGGGDVHMRGDIGRGGVMLPGGMESAEDFVAYMREVRRPELIVTCGA